MLRAARADRAPAPAGPSAPSAAAVPQIAAQQQKGHLLPHRNGRKNKNDHNDKERRRARLFLEVSDALCLVMLAACTVALIRSQMLTAEPAIVPACELFALAAILRVLLGPKQPPPRSPRLA
jgi:hypothetical protein